jgi:hypothetical protein
LASLSMPASSERRAASLNASCFAMVVSFQDGKPAPLIQPEEVRLDLRCGIQGIT